MLWIVEIYGKIADETVIAVFNVAEAYFFATESKTMYFLQASDELLAYFLENFSETRSKSSTLLSEKKLF